MSQALQAPIHLFDYLAFEDASDRRHEYVGGSIHAMTGGTLKHNRIALNLASVLTARLDGTPCQVYINDVKLHVQATDAVYYPDVLVLCGRGVSDSTKVVQDATLVVEVTSESSLHVDSREKRVAYCKLPGLRAYWIVSQSEQRVEVHDRDAAGLWRAAAYGPGEALPLAVLGVDALPMQQVYAGTDLGS